MDKSYEKKLLALYKENNNIKHDRNFIHVFKRLFKNIKEGGIVYIFNLLINILKKIVNKIPIVKRVAVFIKNSIYILFNANKITKILKDNLDKERLIIWYSEVGWDIPLFQRPQHIVRVLSRHHNSLVFYSSLPDVDGNDFLIKNIEDDLFLLNLFGRYHSKFILKYIAKRYRKPKYIYIPSTSMLHDRKRLAFYEKIGYKIIYDYIDDLNPAISGTKHLHKNIIDTHNYVMERPDILVICTATFLINDSIKKRKSDRNIIFACNGVDYEHFTDFSKDVELSKDYQKILSSGKPVIGYYGAIASWFDYEILKKVANELPDYNFVLIGPEYDKTVKKSGISEIRNIYMLGPKKFDELPYYAKHFDICILPFLINDVTNATNPIKIFEYMALEKPIITSDLPECRKYKSCLIYKNTVDFIEMIKENIKLISPDYRKTLIKEAKENTWESKGNIIINKVKQMEKEHE